MLSGWNCLTLVAFINLGNKQVRYLIKKRQRGPLISKIAGILFKLHLSVLKVDGNMEAGVSGYREPHFSPLQSLAPSANTPLPWIGLKTSLGQEP